MKNFFKLNTIFKKIMTLVIFLTVLISFSLNAVSFFVSEKELSNEYEKSLMSKATDSSVIIQERLARKVSELEALANQPGIQSNNWDEQLPVLNTEAERLNYEGIAIVDLKGQAHYTDGETIDLSDRSYVQEALKGKSMISEVIISRKTNAPALLIAVPVIKQDQIQQLLLARIDGYYLSDIVEDIRVGETGFTYIVSDSGKILAHQNKDLVLQETNYITLAKTDATYDEYAKLLKDVITEHSGTKKFKDADGKKMIAFTTIPGTNWVMITGALASEITDGLNNILKYSAILSYVFIFIGIIVAYPFSRSLAKAIKRVEWNGLQLAKGDFTIPVDEKLLLRKDELGSLGRSFEDMRTQLKQMIDQLRAISDQVVVSSDDMYSSSTQVAEATDHIASTMEDIAGNAQASAKASQLTSTSMNETNAGLHRITLSANHVFEAASVSNKLAANGTKMMNGAMTQMDNIYHSVAQSSELLEQLAKQTEEVRSFVDVISSIANETNLLALNASIEAARAGDEGRGFSVIAQQVHKLAAQSQTSAKQAIEIVEHITNSTTKVMTAMGKGQVEVNSGVQAIKEAEHAFLKINNSMQEMTGDLEEISAASQLLTVASDEVTGQMSGMNQMAQQTAASSESILAATEEQTASLQEVASGSSELRNMALNMNEQMKKFKTK
ncbi:methyl-accepting chemotaxis protein [Paenibacillus endoradicis]|uniref:methyl-accepting chemotaxis protein n=1 Tax=Paenibacillus endoradicis TaxID=2972487 RepID=UPI0021598102|nr:methyl-accepting chemotaxis protein [Paenibacillus endoradicis]MCR8659077.1 methyl-accepting chemotaxis protein [Paenibacillus endoradicis]